MIPIFSPAFLTRENAGLTLPSTNAQPHKMFLLQITSSLWRDPVGHGQSSAEGISCQALQKAWGSGGCGTAGILAGRRLDQGCLSFQVWWEGRKGKLGGRTCRGKGEEVFVPALRMSIIEELNCQLMRFPNHVLPFKSRPPIDLIPRRQQGAQLPFSIPQGQRIPRTSARRLRIISRRTLNRLFPVLIAI